MLIYRRTSIFESTAQTLVNTVNCVGVMGKGIAREFKRREPAMFKAYKNICDQKLLAPGKLWLWRGTDSWVLNFPTKVHWRNPSRIEWIEAGLDKFVASYERQGIREVSFPRLGCGNGGLDWTDVRPVMERYLSPLPIPVYIHDYTVDIGLPEHLESVATALRNEELPEPSFDAFIALLRRAVDLTENKFVDLCSEAQFSARMNAENNLEIEAQGKCLTVESDALRGVWISLLNGLVTKEKAGWAVAEGGGPLLSILSVLPQVRPVQIQRSASQPELAVELRPEKRRVTVAPIARKQQELAWE